MFCVCAAGPLVPNSAATLDLTRVFVFSRENLPRDSYLMSQMDSEGYAQIGLVANFNAVKKLTDDINLVKEAIKCKLACFVLYVA